MVRGNVAAVFCMLLWATNFPVVAVLVQSWSAIAITAGRLLIGALVVGIAAIAIGEKETLLRLPRHPAALAAGALLILSTFLFAQGQTLVDPVVAAVLVSAMPVFSVLIDWVSGEQRLTPQMLLAIALAVAGGVITSWPSSTTAAGETSFLGALSMLGGMLAYLFYTKLMIGTLKDEPDVAKSAVSMLIAGAIAAVVLILTDIVGGGVRANLSPRDVGLVLWLGSMSVGASSVLWMWAGRYVGLTIAAMHHNMVPFYVIVMAAIAGAAITLQHVVGATLVIAGAALAQVPVRRLAAGRQP